VINGAKVIETQQLGQPARVDLVTLVAFPHAGVLSRVAHHQFRDMGFQQIVQPGRRSSCQVSPLTRLGQGAQALEAPADKFRDWQENTNSIFWAAGQVAPANGSLVFLRKKKPRLRGQHTRRRNRKNLHPRSSGARRESFCPLDKDLSWKSGRGRDAGCPTPPRTDPTCGITACGSYRRCLASKRK
jgi:hypothetical protein